MTLMVIVHSSDPENRDGILVKGIIPGKPTGKHGNYQDDYDWLVTQPCGVYGYPLGDEWPEWTQLDGTVRPALPKYWADSDDQWQVAYCGPMANDPEVKGAIVLKTRRYLSATLVLEAN